MKSGQLGADPEAIGLRRRMRIRHRSIRRCHIDQGEKGQGEKGERETGEMELDVHGTLEGAALALSIKWFTATQGYGLRTGHWFLGSDREGLGRGQRRGRARDG